MKARKYSWATPERYNVDAQEAGEFIESLPDRQPETILAAARSKNSVLHSLFEWDNSRAAESHRMHQCRQMLGNLVIDVIITVRDKPVTTRVKAIHKVDRAGTREYITDAFVQQDKRDYILAQAFTQLKAFRRRYATLSELAKVFAAMDEVMVKPRKKTG